MICVRVFVLSCVVVFFFYLEWSVLSSGGTIPPNHPDSVALI